MDLKYEKVHTTAVVIIPPENLWPSIQAIRVKYDKAYSRWMPHINLLYPFIPQTAFESEVPKIKEALFTFIPFTITLKSFDFEHENSCTLFLQPDVEPPSALVELQKTLQSLFPFCDDLSTKSEKGFQPHLTVGQFLGKTVTNRRKDEFGFRWKPLTFEVKEIYLIAREGNKPFEIKYSVPLCGGGVSHTSTAHLSSSSSSSSSSLLPSSIVTSNSVPTEVLQEENPKSIAYKQVLMWLQNPNVQSKLPKTRQKLQVAIAPLCRVRQNFDLDIVLKTFIEEGYIEVHNNSTVTYKRQVENSQRTQPSRNPRAYESLGLSFNTFYGFKNDSSNHNQEHVLRRCKEWIVQPQNQLKNYKSLKSALQQLCHIKVVVNSDEIIEELIKNKLISVMDNQKDTLIYHLHK